VQAFEFHAIFQRGCEYMADNQEREWRSVAHCHGNCQSPSSFAQKMNTEYAFSAEEMERVNTTEKVKRLSGGGSIQIQNTTCDSNVFLRKKIGI